ncbi:MAG: hypothetical protein HUU21_17310 [Polyangiaceae bacterium]|nr:hypothetical protein [Polyangiaceae bacterium]
MWMLEKRPYEAITPQPIQRSSGAFEGAEGEPRGAPLTSRCRPVAPDFYSEPEEPLADSVRRVAEQHLDRAVAAASSSGLTSS